MGPFPRTRALKLAGESWHFSRMYGHLETRDRSDHSLSVVTSFSRRTLATVSKVLSYGAYTSRRCHIDSLMSVLNSSVGFLRTSGSLFPIPRVRRPKQLLPGALVESSGYLTRRIHDRFSRHPRRENLRNHRGCLLCGPRYPFEEKIRGMLPIPGRPKNSNDHL